MNKKEYKNEKKKQKKRKKKPLPDFLFKFVIHLSKTIPH